MSLAKLNAALVQDVAALAAEGRAKAAERVIVGYVPPTGDRGPRWKLRGAPQDFLRMNSNSYLSLSHHPAMIEAADQVAREFGVGPGAVRFIDGTFQQHVGLEERIARFMGKPAARIFNSAYTANLGLALTLSGPRTYWIGDELNHNCIIRGMRIAGVPKENRTIYRHNDLDELTMRLNGVPTSMDRVVVIFDGIFSMRGDNAPLDRIDALIDQHRGRFSEGIVTVMDDSHGIGAYGAAGRGTEEHCRTAADVVVGTFGKAFGVNGGFIASSEELIEAARQKADTYIYSNPLSVADCAAAAVAVDLVDGSEGRSRLRDLHARVRQFRDGLTRLGWESIPGPHPIVPLLVRSTERSRALVQRCFDRGVLVVGLDYPVVPRGDETIRFQINAAHTAADIDTVLALLEEFRN
jgi:glycine C-acetyltransferase